MTDAHEDCIQFVQSLSTAANERLATLEAAWEAEAEAAHGVEQELTAHVRAAERTLSEKRKREAGLTQLQRLEAREMPLDFPLPGNQAEISLEEPGEASMPGRGVLMMSPAELEELLFSSDEERQSLLLQERRSAVRRTILRKSQVHPGSHSPLM